jgi:tetratricopeptide (TPR) repeat protein
VRLRTVGLIYLGLSVALWPVPLLGVLHAESSAVVAGVAFFVSGWAAVRAFRRSVRQAAPEGTASLGSVLMRQEAALAVPWAGLTATLLWQPNAGYAQGLLLFLLFAPVSVALAVALAYALTGLGVRRPGWVLTGVGLGILVAGPLYDLSHPQFYSYNHVFGGVLGPIYDEQLAVRTGLFVFRGLTLAWAAALVLVGLWGRARRKEKGKREGARAARAYAIGALVVLVLIGGSYAFSARLGINTTSDRLQAALGGHRQTAHFDIYYDPSALLPHRVDAIAETHEYRYHQLTQRLDLAADERPTGRIRTYLYPTPEVKARLTGARTTSVAPVWLPAPQMHLLQSRFDASFGHELAHVAARPFGLPVLNASWAVGLVEGWAVALEPPSRAPPPRDQVAAALTASPPGADSTTSLTDRVRRQADGIAARLTPQGFWTGRSAVSYTTMGAFVDFLLDRYGPEPLKTAYAWADFEAVYGVPVDSLADAWARALVDEASVHRSAGPLVQRRFARPSLFERASPHYVPPHRRALEQGQDAWRRGDTTRARRAFERALSEQPTYGAAHAALAQLRLSQGQARRVQHQLDTLDAARRGPTLERLRGHAHALGGASDTARAAYRRARAQRPVFQHEARAQLTLAHQVAGRPAVVRVLTSADSAAAQARALGTYVRENKRREAGAVQAWQALRHMAAGEHAAAARLWRALVGPPQAPAPPARGTAEADGAARIPWAWTAALNRAQALWAAVAHHRSGQHPAAIAYAQRAATTYRRVGDTASAAVAADWARRARWAQQRQEAKR